MTRIEQIDADPFLVLSVMIRARPRHPRSIDAFFPASANCFGFGEFKAGLYASPTPSIRRPC